MATSPKDVIIFTECHWYSGFARNAGSYRIATELRNHGYSVQVIDFFGFLNIDDIKKIRDKFIDANTLAICFSSTFFNKAPDEKFYDPEGSTLDHVLCRIDISKKQDDNGKINQEYPYSNEVVGEILALFRESCPDFKVVYGGSKAQYQRAEFVDCYMVDFGEKAIIEYVNKLRFSKTANLTPSNLPKLIAFNKDTDDFQFSTSTIEWSDDDFIFTGEALPIEISRGCIFKCAFCSYLLTGKKNLDHVKNVDVLYGELMRNYEKFGTTNYIFCDDTFNDSTEKLGLLARMVDRLPFKLSFSGYIRPELTANNPEQLDLLRHIGLRFAKMGIESLNSETRKIIGKGTSLERILKCLADMRAHWGDEVITSGSFVFGLPKETKESILFQEQWLINDALNYLHCFSVLPLFINFTDLETVKKSEITFNYSAYNYQHIDGRNWYNPDFDFSFEELAQMSKRLYSIAHADPRFKHGGFSASMIQNTGISYEHIKNHHFSQLPYYDAQLEYARKIDEYKSKLLK